MHHLHRRVHAGVGATGGDDRDRLPGDRRQRALEGILHSAGVCLRLPTVKRHAVVFESERDAHVRSVRRLGYEPARWSWTGKTRGGGSAIRRTYRYKPLIYI